MTMHIFLFVVVNFNWADMFEPIKLKQISNNKFDL